MPVETEVYVVREPHANFKIEPVTIDEVRAGEVLIETVAFSVCASDLKAAHGAFFLKPPLIPGHEGSGIVKQVGSGVTSVQPGDPVILSFSSCGNCHQCQSAAPAYCDDLLKWNFSGTRADGSRAVSTQDGVTLNSFFFGQSSMSRLALAHESSVVKLPQETSIEDLRKFAPLGCGMQTGAGALLNVCKPRAGASIAITGCGAVGLAAALAALTTSPSHIILVDNDSRKFAHLPSSLRDSSSKSQSATSTASTDASGITSYTLSSDTRVTLIDTSVKPDIQATLLSSTANKGLDYVLECAGRPALVTACIPALSKRGTLVTVGGSAPADPPAGAKLTDMLVGGRTWRGTHQGDSEPRTFLSKLIGLWKEGRFAFDELLGYYKFDELEKGLDDWKEGRVVKVVCVVK